MRSIFIISLLLCFTSVYSQKNVLIGKVNYAKDTNFVLVDSTLTSKPIYLHKEVNKQFELMYKAALKDGIHLKIISGARNYYHQKSIWERKWENLSGDSLQHLKNILQYSAMPMTSRHHWGTEVDLNSLENSYFEKGAGLKTYLWLVANAHKYGFCQVYNDKSINNRKGYEMEKWHWSYMPIAKKYLELYNTTISYDDLKGITGSHLAKRLMILEDYVNGVADCKNDSL